MINQDASVEVKVWVWWFCDWRDDGKLKATTSPLATVHTGVKPQSSFPQLKSLWTNPRQGWSPAQQPWECSRTWRGCFWWIKLVCHQLKDSKEENFKFNFVSAYFFKISFSFGFIPGKLRHGFICYGLITDYGRQDLKFGVINHYVCDEMNMCYPWNPISLACQSEDCRSWNFSVKYHKKGPLALLTVMEGNQS